MQAIYTTTTVSGLFSNRFAKFGNSPLQNFLILIDSLGSHEGHHVIKFAKFQSILVKNDWAFSVPGQIFNPFFLRLHDYLNYQSKSKNLAGAILKNLEFCKPITKQAGDSGCSKWSALKVAMTSLFRRPGPSHRIYTVIVVLDQFLFWAGWWDAGGPVRI